MTRFARAKGSKASNERVPEAATSWQEMKEQMLAKNKEKTDSKMRESAEAQRLKNYQAFLAEQEEDKLKNTKWANFEHEKKPEKRKIKKSKIIQATVSLASLSEFEVKESAEVSTNENKNDDDDDVDDDDAPEEISAKIPNPQIKVNVVKKVKQVPLKISVDNKKTNKSNKKIASKEKINDSSKGEKANVEGSVVIITKVSHLDKTLSEQDLKKIQKKKERRMRQLEKKKKKKEELKANEQESKQSIIKPKFEQKQTKNVKSKKKINEHQKKRRKPVQNLMIINGEEVEIAHVDGFPVRKEDATRLGKLRREMISKGLPNSEIRIALKLERRKAEKAFARLRKKVCFNCRKSGHNLSECPDLNNNKGLVEDAAFGICFKCGSTEHTHFECKVVKNQEFKFAQCFICKEQGHIARQCPDNARGLYPKGGACNVCGDVTHLKKDCPQFQMQKQQESENFKIETIDEAANPDDLSVRNVQKTYKFTNNNNKSKIIKFSN